MSPDDEIRRRVLLENRLYDQVGACACLFEDDLIERQVDLLVLAYVELAQTLEFAPTSDMLPNFGWPGLVLHELFGTETGTWDAFRTMVDRRYPDLLNPGI